MLDKLFIVCLLLNFSSTVFAQEYDGAINAVEYYDLSGDSIEYYRNIWYLNSKDTYVEKETEAFNRRRIAFRNEEFQMISDDISIEVLEELGVITGLMRGYYYPKGVPKDEDNMKQTYIACLGVDIKEFNIHVKFKGAHFQYMLNYALDPPKRKGYAFFRLPSEQYKKDDEYLIEAKKTRTRLTIVATYNLQTLTLTITRREKIIDAILRKVGLNRNSIPLFPEP